MYQRWIFQQIRTASRFGLASILLLTAPVFAASGDEDLEEVPSPLVSEFAVSPVVKTIMPGGWWHDRSAAHLVVEDVILRSVGVSKKKKGRKGIVLMVRAEVSSLAYAQSVDEVKVELFDEAGKRLSSRTWDDILVGRDLGPSSVAGTRFLVLEHAVSRDDLDALFAGEAQPKVRVTVTEVD